MLLIRKTYLNITYPRENGVFCVLNSYVFQFLAIFIIRHRPFSLFDLILPFLIKFLIRLIIWGVFSAYFCHF
jgi:ABC-type spermidine/putrescine transport system permease subunit I